MKIALYVGIAGAVLAIVYYFWHFSGRVIGFGRGAERVIGSGRGADTAKARRVRELTRAPTVAENAAMASRLSAKARATWNLSNLSTFY